MHWSQTVVWASSSVPTGGVWMVRLSVMRWMIAEMRRMRTDVVSIFMSMVMGSEYLVHLSVKSSDGVMSICGDTSVKMEVVIVEIGQNKDNNFDEKTTQFVDFI